MRWRPAATAAVCGLGSLCLARISSDGCLVTSLCSSKDPSLGRASSPGDIPSQQPSGLRGVTAKSGDVLLPWDKLACHMPRQLAHATESTLSNPRGAKGVRPQAVLLLPGSFNPPTHAHLRMLELARDALQDRGWDVLGAYMSPVNDKYGKQGLAPASHRVRMCQLATQDSPFIMVDAWEASQPDNQRTLNVLQRITATLNASPSPPPSTSTSVPGEPGNSTPEGSDVRVVLVCGADLLRSVTRQGVWIPEQVETMLSNHGVVCISRDGEYLRSCFFDSDTLYKHRDNILVVDNTVYNNISSSKIRTLFARGLSVKYLLPDLVVNYMEEVGLYKS